MSYQAIARKYRPETFKDVVGQEHVTSTLRAAQSKGKLSHAYLFSGPRGCGKTTVARLLAKAINCPDNQDGSPCGACGTCAAIAKGNFMDVLEIDAASNTGVDNIRELRDMAQYSSSEGSSRVFIIDEVHMLSKGAFNALLKILEEPPPRVYFFFATTEPNKIPRTILSRCQRFDFRLLSRTELADRMLLIATAEGVIIEEAGLRLLVSLAEGSVRDGLSLLDQVIAGCDGTISEESVVAAFGLVATGVYLEFNEAVISRDPARALKLVENLQSSGQSLDSFARGIVTNFRNMMLLRIDPELANMVDLPPDQVEKLQVQANSFSEQDLLALIDRSGSYFERIHRSTQPRIMLEASLVEYCRFESRVMLSDLARRLEGLGITGGPAGGSEAGPSGGYVRTPAAATKPRSAPEARPGSGGAISAAPVQYNNDDIPGWTQIIDNLMKKAPGVASCLMIGKPVLDKEKGQLAISFAEDKAFQVQSIRGKVALIEETASAQWGTAIKVELVLGNAGQTKKVHEEIRQEVAPTHREELNKARSEDAVLDKLVGTMDGEPLPETDRERWNPPS